MFSHSVHQDPQIPFIVPSLCLGHYTKAPGFIDPIHLNQMHRSIYLFETVLLMPSVQCCIGYISLLFL